MKKLVTLETLLERKRAALHELLEKAHVEQVELPQKKKKKSDTEDEDEESSARESSSSQQSSSTSSSFSSSPSSSTSSSSPLLSSLDAFSLATSSSSIFELFPFVSFSAL